MRAIYSHRGEHISLFEAISRILLIFLPTALIQCESIETPAVTEKTVPGDQLPSFAIQLSIADTLDWRYGIGTTFDTAKLQDKVGIIVFFHTSCKDCKRWLPVIQSAYDIIKNDMSVSLVCISRAEQEAEICDYFNSNELSLPYSPQSDRRIYELFATSGIPRIYVADTKGIVRNVFTDRDTPNLTELMNAIDNCRKIHQTGN